MRGWNDEVVRRFAICAVVAGVLLVMAPVAPTHAQDSDTEGTSGDTPQSGEVAQSTVVYDEEFFAQYPNAVSAVDLIRRIPGGQQLLNQNNTAMRGFSSNDDRILINGRRVSGKANSSEGVLGRITVDQIERIELIRGGSPDIKVSSQDAIINIVTIEDGASGAGSWRADARVARTEDIRFGGFLSYGGSLGGFEYFASAEVAPKLFVDKQKELTFLGEDALIERLDETITRKGSIKTVSANLGYNFDNGDQLRLNGLYSVDKYADRSPGQRFDVTMAGGFTPAGEGLRVVANDVPKWEIGGDIDTGFLGDDFRVKLIGLYSVTDTTFTQREDFLITDGTVADDVLSIFSSTAREGIGRGSVIWQINPDHQLEIGSELSLNSLDVDLNFFEREGGELVKRDVSASNVTVKETRDESFAIHSWTINDKMSLESTIYLEYSRISQSGDTSRRRTFVFARPSSDFRYDLTPSDQFQLSVRRTVSQLAFGDFASTVSADDEVVGGNTELVPEKAWQFEAAFEHRLPNDGGSIKPSILYANISDKIQRIRIADGISGVGNVGNARRIKLRVEGTFRLGIIGLPDLVIEPVIQVNLTRLTDPFTGRSRRFNYFSNYFTELGLRHDLSDWGMSYGAQISHWSEWSFHDIDEVIRYPGPVDVSAWVEYKLFAGIVARVDLYDISDRRFGRNRLLFDDGVETGVITGRQFRDQRRGRITMVSLKGTF